MMEKLKSLLPDVEFCKKIPKNRFKDTLFVVAVDKKGLLDPTYVFRNNPSIYETSRYEFYPAPLLEEIYEEAGINDIVEKEEGLNIVINEEKIKIEEFKVRDIDSKENLKDKVIEFIGETETSEFFDKTNDSEFFEFLKVMENIFVEKLVKKYYIPPMDHLVVEEIRTSKDGAILGFYQFSDIVYLCCAFTSSITLPFQAMFYIKNDELNIYIPKYGNYFNHNSKVPIFDYEKIKYDGFDGEKIKKEMICFSVMKKVVRK